MTLLRAGSHSLHSQWWSEFCLVISNTMDQTRHHKRRERNSDVVSKLAECLIAFGLASLTLIQLQISVGWECPKKGNDVADKLKSLIADRPYIKAIVREVSV